MAAALLGNTTLKGLILDMNDLEKYSVMALGGALRTNTTLRKLRLGGNPGAHAPEGALYFACALLGCPWHR